MFPGVIAQDAAVHSESHMTSLDGQKLKRYWLSMFHTLSSNDFISSASQEMLTPNRLFISSTFSTKLSNLFSLLIRYNVYFSNQLSCY